MCFSVNNFCSNCYICLSLFRHERITESYISILFTITRHCPIFFSTQEYLMSEARKALLLLFFFSLSPNQKIFWNCRYTIFKCALGGHFISCDSRVWGWEVETSYLPTRSFQHATKERNIIHPCDTSRSYSE